MEFYTVKGPVFDATIKNNGGGNLTLTVNFKIPDGIVLPIDVAFANLGDLEEQVRLLRKSIIEKPDLEVTSGWVWP
jgi:hypothetical protein